MCLWVEKSHLRELVDSVDTALDELRKEAPSRAHDLLFDLPPAAVLPAIIFRDFPKRHGNIIQRAVGIALENHPGGYVQTSASFRFLSGLQVEVDNFFMAADGQIYLFETKRDQRNIREEGVAGQNLMAVKMLIEAEVRRQTGRSLRSPIKLAYFSYADASFPAPKPLQVNVGSKVRPQLVDMPVYSRADMNALIGPCFGRYLHVVDRLIDTAVSKAVPEMTNEQRLADSAQEEPLVTELFDETEDGPLKFGEPPELRQLTENEVLM